MASLKMVPLSDDRVRECVDSALAALSRTTTLVVEIESMMDFRKVRSALTFYRHQRCGEKSGYIGLPIGSINGLTLMVLQHIETLLGDSGNSVAQKAVLRSCQQRLQTLLQRRQLVEAEWADRPGIHRSLPNGDGLEGRAS